MIFSFLPMPIGLMSPGAAPPAPPASTSMWDKSNPIYSGEAPQQAAPGGPAQGGKPGGGPQSGGTTDMGMPPGMQGGQSWNPSPGPPPAQMPPMPPPNAMDSQFGQNRWGPGHTAGPRRSGGYTPFNANDMITQRPEGYGGYLEGIANANLPAPMEKSAQSHIPMQNQQQQGKKKGGK